METSTQSINKSSLAPSLLLGETSNEVVNIAADFTEWLLSPELNLVKKISKARKQSSSQEASAYHDALHQAAINLIQAKHEHEGEGEGEGEPFLKPQINSFQYMTKLGGFPTDQQRDVLTYASERYFRVYFRMPPSSQHEGSRSSRGEEGLDSVDGQAEEAQLSPINTTSSDTHILDPAPSMNVSLAPSTSANPDRRIHKRPINSISYESEEEDDEGPITTSNSSCETVVPISNNSSNNRASSQAPSQAPKRPCRTSERIAHQSEQQERSRLQDDSDESLPIHLLNSTMLRQGELQTAFELLTRKFHELRESLTATAATAAATTTNTVSSRHFSSPPANLSPTPAPLDTHMSNQLTVHTTDSLPRLTLRGDQSIKNPVNIDKLESYIKRSHGPQITLAHVAEPKVIDVMMSMFRTRQSLIIKKVNDDPFAADAEETPLWPDWPLIKILQVWRPCQAANSRATQALTLRE